MDFASLNDILKVIDGYIGGSSWFVFALLGTGIFFTVYLKFPQIRFFKHAIDVVRGKFDKEGAKGDTSHFQSLATALSGTVGTGNICGSSLCYSFRWTCSTLLYVSHCSFRYDYKVCGGYFESQVP